MLTTHVFSTLRVAGFHNWPEAPTHLAFLCDRHLHDFHVRVEVPVTVSREVEFYNLQAATLQTFDCFVTSREGYEFGPRSCEDLAIHVFGELCGYGYPVASVTVAEDGKHGATVRRLDD